MGASARKLEFIVSAVYAGIEYQVYRNKVNGRFYTCVDGELFDGESVDDCLVEMNAEMNSRRELSLIN